jgi:hypothetical protein
MTRERNAAVLKTLQARAAFPAASDGPLLDRNFMDRLAAVTTHRPDAPSENHPPVLSKIQRTSLKCGIRAVSIDDV